MHSTARKGKLNEVYSEKSLLGFMDRQNNIDLVYAILQSISIFLRSYKEHEEGGKGRMRLSNISKNTNLKAGGDQILPIKEASYDTSIFAVCLCCNSDFCEVKKIKIKQLEYK